MELERQLRAANVVNPS